jgi:hypothetical protein
LSEGPYAAFWSYTRFDDQNDGAWLTELRGRLVAEVRALSAKRVEIFQDIEGIGWGERWKDKLLHSADQALFLIPIITPSYFDSDRCRDELEQFVERENVTAFKEFILPLYYITCDHLEDVFRKASDRLARVVADHNYRDIRKDRHRSLESYDGRKVIKSLATSLIERLNAYERLQCSSKEMRGRIVVPPDRQPVPNRTIMFGTLEHVSTWTDVWLVVETGGAIYHPQTRLAADAWQATISIGRSASALDKGRIFPVHILAVTQDVSKAFTRYQKDAAKHRDWHGVPEPPESQVLATVNVIRDDTASMFGFLEGTYQEQRSDGTPTGGTITLKFASPDTVNSEARSSNGRTEWNGSIKLTASPDEITGHGQYQYLGKLDSGQHDMTVDRATGNLKLTGRNTSSPEGRQFAMIWKRRAT